MQFKPTILKSGETSIKFIKWAYDPEKGRAMPKCLGTALASWEKVPAIILKQCSPSELAVIEEFWKANRAGVEKERVRRSYKKFIDLLPDLETVTNSLLLTESEYQTLSNYCGFLKYLADNRKDWLESPELRREISPEDWREIKRNYGIKSVPHSPKTPPVHQGR